MKEKMFINLLGHCDKCRHVLSRNIEVRLDHSCLKPCECPECHDGTVYFEKLAVHHRPRTEYHTQEEPGILFPRWMVSQGTGTIFRWGLLAVGMYILLACGLVFRLADGMQSLWRYVLIGGLVLVLFALSMWLCALHDRAEAVQHRSPHSFLPDE